MLFRCFLLGTVQLGSHKLHEDLPANPPTPQTKNINKKNRHWNLKPWSPPNKKKERRFFKSNQTTQFLSGPRAVFHLEAVDLTHVFCPWMVCVCVFCTPSAPKKKKHKHRQTPFSQVAKHLRWWWCGWVVSKEIELQPADFSSSFL